MAHPSCVGYIIVFADDIKKDLKGFEKQTISKILGKIKKLTSATSDNLNIKKLKSKILLYRLRIGNYRAVYTIKHKKIIVYVVAIGHRKDIYNILNKRLAKII